MNEFITINLGGYPTRVSSYDRLLKFEQGIEGYDQLNDHAYNSILFHNLGFDKCPNGLQWIESNKPIEWIAKESTDALDVPMTKHKLMLIGPTSLLDLMRIVNKWGCGNVEYGNILDYVHSFTLPSKDQIEYLIRNNYKISRKPVIKKKTDSWLTSNVEMRRLYNINPNVDEEYYENCFMNYTKYFKNAIIMNPIPLFVASIIDPGFLFFIIRESEIQAAKIANMTAANGIPALRTDESMYDEFIKIFSGFENTVNRLFEEEGAFAFTRDIRNSAEFVSSGSIQAPYMTQKASLENRNKEEFYKMIDETDVIANINLTVGDYLENVVDDEDRKKIFKYVDKRSIPKFLTEPVEDSNGIKNIPEAYNKVLIRLKRIVSCLENIFPDILDSKDRIIMSKPFYLDENRFGLYSKATKELLVATNDNKIFIMTLKNAIDLYKNLYGTTVLLDPKEIPPETSPAVPRTSYDFMNTDEKKNENVPHIKSEPIPTAPDNLVNNHYQTSKSPDTIKVDSDGMISINISNYVEQ